MMYGSFPNAGQHVSPSLSFEDVGPSSPDLTSLPKEMCRAWPFKAFEKTVKMALL